MAAIRNRTARRRRSSSAAPTPPSPACSKASWSPTRRSSRWSARPTRPGCAATSPVCGRQARMEGSALFRTDSVDDIINAREHHPGPRLLPERRRRRAARASKLARNTSPAAGCSMPATASSMRPTSSPATSPRPTIRRRMPTATSMSCPATASPASRSTSSRPAPIIWSRRNGRSAATWWRWAAVFRRRRRQPEREAAGLLGRQPAHLLSGHQERAGVRGWSNNLFNNKYRAVRHLFRAGRRRGAGLPIVLTDQRTEVPGAAVRRSMAASA